MNMTKQQKEQMLGFFEKESIETGDVEQRLGFPLSELTEQDAEKIITCMMDNRDLGDVLGNIIAGHEVNKDKQKALGKDEGFKTASEIVKKETIINEERQETSIVSTPGSTDMMTAIDMIDIDGGVALYNKFEEAKRKLAKPEDIQDLGNRKFYKKSFWRKCATAFGVQYQVKSVQNLQIKDEFVVRVTVTAKWGNRVTEDIGVCSSKEFTGRRKFNIPDCEATATTRAINRAISDIVGGGEVTADEIQRD